MSSYKASLSRPQQPESIDSKYRTQAQQLQELFPTWSNEDLHTLLAEVGGDVQIAATRISEGHAEQWGSVTRKKDKKQPSHVPHKDSISGRGDRGARGGRGGRGGPGRGAGGSSSRARGGSGRGGHGATNGHVTSSPSAGTVTTPGTTPATSWVDISSLANTPAVDAVDSSSATPATKPADADAWSNTQEGTSSWPASSTNQSQPGRTIKPSDSTWDSKNGDVKPPPPTSSASVPGNLNSKAPSAKAISKVPATSKLSWAEIARPQEKLTAPAPPTSVPSSTSAPVSITPAVDSPTTPSATSKSDLPESTSQGWEEPTTVQPPTWDEAPSAKPSVEPWVGSEADSALTDDETPEPEAVEVLISQDPAPVLEISSSVPDLPETHEAQPASPLAQQPTQPQAPQKPTVQTTRTANTAHRSSARYKNVDQPVIMPSSILGGLGSSAGVGGIGFGSGLGSGSGGLEKVGMQFGSLSLGGDNFDSNASEPASADEPSAPEPPTPQSAISQQSHEPSSAISSSGQSSLSNGSNLFQQGLPQQQTTQHPLPSITQPSQASVQTQPPSQTGVTGTAPIPPFAHQSLSGHQQQQLPQSQQQAHATHQQYAQHGLPTHLDPTQQGQPQPQQSPQQPQQPQQLSQQQQQQGAQHSSYFRQPDTSPYFHSPTPPAGQGQDAYGAFGQLGHTHAQVQHQGQQNHLAGFGGGDYGYGDSQRGFYESYAQQSSAFGNRNVLGHDDVKGLPSAPQQPPASATLPPANSQSSQQLAPSAQGGAPQPAAGQGPQQGYPPPLPYYYPYPQNQYYGTPYNSGYGVPQPFVKYPGMFQPGPPGPGSAPSPVAKQGPTNVPPPSNPYGQSLYQQHPSAAYDESGYQHHTQQHQHQHSHGQSAGGGLPSNDYGKHQQQLYGGAQGMQGFMGLGQSTGPSSGPPIGQRGTGGGSPEAPYKPYAPNTAVKDVGAGVGGVGIGQGGVGQSPQTRAGAQQAQQGFYGANRFGSGSATGPQGQPSQQHQPSSQGPQVGYPQGATDGFYPYQQRQQQQQQQQQYWQ